MTEFSLEVKKEAALLLAEYYEARSVVFKKYNECAYPDFVGGKFIPYVMVEAISVIGLIHEINNVKMKMGEFISRVDNTPAIDYREHFGGNKIADILEDIINERI